MASATNIDFFNKSRSSCPKLRRSDEVKNMIDARIKQNRNIAQRELVQETSNVSSPNIFCKRRKVLIHRILSRIRNLIIAFFFYSCFKMRSIFSLITTLHKHIPWKIIYHCVTKIFFFLKSPNMILYIA